ncbi:FkbM family methyltransferase [Pseudochryseolinea flava]|uniref:Methyltransferase FkbM domain-containing protein n=1 Tax=Pseudochryseolinea flava TaxID=2059302 RepID=A0A364Y3D4_9BACT|nr:FkbM family methyltransferase [Pseudochryseolinea flava]RAW01296.1 hypothetical protein DQQ10_10325 [Pseudochryseolinea flava]
MGFKFARLIHSISLRIPQAYALRSGMRVVANTTAQHSLFWSTFTSREYMSLMPEIIKANLKPSLFIDCGAATGYVTMLFHHLMSAGVLEWDIKKTLCVEPSTFNAGVLETNLSTNGIESQLFFGVAGKREGSVDFFETSRNPWSSSINKRFHQGAPAKRNYIDLVPFLATPCFLKVDIEGSEFDFITTYKDSLANVQGVIMEWHYEMGDVEKSEKELLDSGFVKAKTSLDKDRRRVSLYLRK